MHTITGKFNTKVLSGLLGIVLLTACVDQDFDIPPSGGQDPDIEVTNSIAELKAMHALGDLEEIKQDIVVSGLVISDDEAGNFFRQILIEDSTGGIEIRVDATNLHTEYPTGRRIFVKCRGLWLGDFNNLIQLGAHPALNEDGEIELQRIPESVVDKYILKGTYGHDLVPTFKEIPTLTIADVSTLIRLDNVQFITADTARNFADAENNISLNHEIENCLDQRLIFRSSGFASFANAPVPNGNGTVVGILGIFGSDLQLLIRDLNDIDFSGERCQFGGEGINSFSDNFGSFDDDEDIESGGWTNLAVKGTRLWRAQEFNGNIYAQATAFGDNFNQEMESWLITPAIDLTAPKTLRFLSAKAFWTHDAFTVYAGTNFDGESINLNNWEELTEARTAEQSDADHDFIDSGEVDIPALDDRVFIAFRYVGSGPQGLTTSYRIDDVVIQNK